MSVDATSIDTLNYSRSIRSGVRQVSVAEPGRRGIDGTTSGAPFEQALERILSGAVRADPDADTTEELLGDGDLPDVRFSRHATGRIRSRGIELDDTELELLSDAIDSLTARKARSSLLLMGEKAFIVGVEKRTVITAMSRKEAVGSTFTNIDSAMVLR